MRVLKLMPLLMAVAIAACGKADNGDGGLSAIDSKLYSLFDPVAASAVIPFPNDGLFAGGTDGTLNIPNSGGTPFVTDANRLDGFSTVASLFTDLIGRVDMTSANEPGSIIVINTRTLTPLVPGSDYRVQLSTVIDPATGFPLDQLRSRLLIEPLKPLSPKTTYLVAVTRQLKSTDGEPAEPAELFKVVTSSTAVADQTLPILATLNDAKKTALEDIRQLYVTRILPGLNAAGLPTESLAIAWPFTTQSVSDTLVVLNDSVSAQSLTVVRTGLTTQDAIPQLPPIADIYVGSLVLPYYLADATATSEDLDFLIGGAADNPLNSYWRADGSERADGAAPNGAPCAALAPSDSTTACFPQPRARAAQTVPVLVTLPNANSGQTMPESGWPVVVFQHGITGSRSQMLPLAPAMAAAGYAVIAIDLPLHGLPAGDPLRVAGTTERSFDLDLVNNASGLPPGGDGIDPSGTHFINLTSLITSRDNLRQGVADLFTVTASAGTALILQQTETGLAPTGAFLDGSKVRHIGHSLGGIVTSTFLGVNQTASAAVLAMPGGGIAKLLDGSASFGPRISAGLAASTASRPIASRINEGNDNYETYLRFAQTLVDSGDPINFATAATARHPVLMFEVVGDAVVPNCTVSASATCPATDVIPISGYLSGSDPLARALGLSYVPGPNQADSLDVPTASQTITGSAARANVVRFSQGDHGSILSPAANALVTCEMQRQTATYIASNGGVLNLGACSGAATN